MLKLVIELNDDGTVLFPQTDREATDIAEWCRRHEKGIIFAQGDCADKNWQHVHFQDHATALEAKRVHLAVVAEPDAESAE